MISASRLLGGGVIVGVGFCWNITYRLFSKSLDRIGLSNSNLSEAATEISYHGR